MVRSSLLFACTAIAAFAGAHSNEAESLSQRRQGTPPGYGVKKPKLNSKKLQAAIKTRALQKKGKELEDIAYSTPDRNRVFSSPGHLKSLDWVESYLDPSYYTWYRQELVALYSQSSGNLSTADVAYEPSVFSYSPSGDVTANIVAVANLGCEATDYPVEVAGAIALISRGVCPFGNKSALAGAAGAAAAIIYNNIATPLGGGTLGPPPSPLGDYVPSVSIERDNATALLKALSAGPVEGVVQVESVIENRTTYNLVAETKGGDKNSVLAIGGHLDSVYAGPGINDDGSGSIGILETAIQLAKFSTKNAVRFHWWTAEEFGLLGSEYYVEHLTDGELEKIKLYLNFDMIASPNFIYALYDGDQSEFPLNSTSPPGSAESEAFFEDYFESLGLSTTPTAYDGRSDYGPFLAPGVPCAGVFTGAEGLKSEEEAVLFGGEAGVAYDVNYHQAGDNYTNLNFEAFTINTKAIAAAVAEYATSFRTIPPRNSMASKMNKARGLGHVHPHKRQSLKAQHTHAKDIHDCGAASKMEM